MVAKRTVGMMAITFASAVLLSGCGDDTGGGGDGDGGSSNSGGGSSSGCSSASECPEVQCPGENFPSRTCALNKCRTAADCPMPGTGGNGGSSTGGAGGG